MIRLLHNRDPNNSSETVSLIDTSDLFSDWFAEYKELIPFVCAAPIDEQEAKKQGKQKEAQKREN